MKQLSFLTLIFLLGLTQVEAKPALTCPKTSEKDKKTKKVNLIREMPPIRDQDTIGWCYSFAAADLLTHYLYKTKGKKVQGNTVLATNYLQKESSVSAMGIATMYNQTNFKGHAESLFGLSSQQLVKMNKSTVVEQGTISKSLDNVKKNGFCLERDVSSGDFSHVADQRCVEKNRCQILEVINNIYDSKECDTCKDFSPFLKVFPSLSLKDITKVIVDSSKQNALNNLVNAACYKKFKKSFSSDQPRYKTIATKVGAAPKRLFDFIDNHLDRGIPVGIAYFADFFYGRQTNKSTHASSLIGKTYNPKTCQVEYILRNSWGTGCGFYAKKNPEYDKCFKAAASTKNKKEYNFKVLNCKNTYKPISKNPAIRCESPGYLYVQKSELEKHVFSVTAIQEDQIF